MPSNGFGLERPIEKVIEFKNTTLTRSTPLTSYVAL